MMITIKYAYCGDISDLTPPEINSLTAELKAEGYHDWYITGNELILDGDIDVDDYSISADDVDDEIRFICYKHDVYVDGKSKYPNDYHTVSDFDEQRYYFCKDLFY